MENNIIINNNLFCIKIIILKDYFGLCPMIKKLYNIIKIINLHHKGNIINNYIDLNSKLLIFHE